MKFDLNDPFFVMARVEGLNGKVRELRAILDINSHFSLIFPVHAKTLGYEEAMAPISSYGKVFPNRVALYLGLLAIERGILINLKKVSIGKLEAENVETVIPEIPPSMWLPFDLILGRSFLKNFRLTFDGRNKYLILK